MTAQARIPLPDWPRLMQRQKAAAYVDMSVPTFEIEIALGRMPASVMVGGREHWCRKALDAAVDRLLDDGPTDALPHVTRMREAIHAAKTS